MARHRKGTTDHDGDGKMGGSMPALTLDERVARLEKAVALADPVAASRMMKGN